MKRNEQPLHQRQMEIGTGLIVNESMPKKTRKQGNSTRMENSSNINTHTTFSRGLRLQAVILAPDGGLGDYL